MNPLIKQSAEIIYTLCSTRIKTNFRRKITILGNDLSLTIKPEDFFTASITGNKLTIKALKSESSYASPYPRTGYRFTYKGTYTDPRSGGVPDNCMWYVVVRDKVSGEEALLDIDITSTVTNISLSDTIYAF